METGGRTAAAPCSSHSWQAHISSSGNTSSCSDHQTRPGTHRDMWLTKQINTHLLHAKPTKSSELALTFRILEPHLFRSDQTTCFRRGEKHNRLLFEEECEQSLELFVDSCLLPCVTLQPQEHTNFLLHKLHPDVFEETGRTLVVGHGSYATMTPSLPPARRGAKREKVESGSSGCFPVKWTGFKVKPVCVCVCWEVERELDTVQGGSASRCQATAATVNHCQLLQWKVRKKFILGLFSQLQPLSLKITAHLPRYYITVSTIIPYFSQEYKFSSLQYTV